MTQYFVIYQLNSQVRLQEEFKSAFGPKPPVTLKFSQPSADIADKYAADGPTDYFLEVIPANPIGISDEDRVVECVKTAASAAGSSFSPVRQ